VLRKIFPLITVEPSFFFLQSYFVLHTIFTFDEYPVGSKKQQTGNLSWHTKEKQSMKKTLLIVGLVVLALGILGVGVAFAQGGQPPMGQGG
jgi:hypothetical protein